MKISKALFLFAIVVMVIGCTTVKGTVQIVPKDLDTDKGMYNSPSLLLGSAFHVRKEGTKLVATRIEDLEPTDSDVTKGIEANQIAQASSGTTVDITVDPADSEIEAFAKTQFKNSVTLVSTNFTRKSIKKIPDFLDKNKQLFITQIKAYPDEAIWLITSSIVCEKLSIQHDVSIDAAIKAKFPKVTTVAVSTDTDVNRRFEITVAENGERIPVFLSFQRITLAADGSFKTQAVTAEEYMITEWGAK